MCSFGTSPVLTSWIIEYLGNFLFFGKCGHAVVFFFKKKSLVCWRNGFVEKHIQSKSIHKLLSSSKFVYPAKQMLGKKIVLNENLSYCAKWKQLTDWPWIAKFYAKVHSPSNPFPNKFKKEMNNKNYVNPLFITWFAN